jgi:tetratricopeptide (TPR) repeat protein
MTSDTLTEKETDMRALTLSTRPLLLGLLVALAFPALANPNCGDEALAPPERFAACEATLKTVTDPVEKARLLILRAQSSRQQINIDAVSMAFGHLTEIERLLPDMSSQMRTAVYAERGLLIVQAQSKKPQIKIDAASKAMADLEESLRLLPNMSSQMRADLLVERAEIHRLSDARDKALKDLDEAELLAPAAANPIVSRSLMLFEQGQEQRAIEQLAKALKLEPNNSRALYHGMRQAHFSGNNPSCIEYGTRALNASPRDARILAMRARCLAHSGHTAEMEADIRKVEEIGPWAAVVLGDITLAFLALNRYGEAAAAARRAIQMDPTFQDAYFDLTTALMASGAYDEALATFRALPKSGIVDRVGLANNISWELYLAGRYSDALQIVSDWLVANPKPIDEPHSIANAQGYPVVVDTAAHILTALGRQEEAVATFLRAAKLSPNTFRPKYEERLAALGFAAKDGDAGLEAALRTCVATGANCKLYGDDPRR